ncbi:ferredoxin [Phytohabitans kaempferiae]|uniref:Ferredoxin n=1 Tax=Phytohabitans kaempferiae TaxID=1620943 RepID=A0ABV6M4Z6_9ACTN
MRITVDENLCDFHGQCEIAAGSIFQLVGPADLRYQREVSGDLRTEAEAAADLCPAQAIQLDD